MERTEQNKMGVMPMGKLLMQMSVPLMMSLLIQSLYNIVDSMFVAGYSEEALTATTLAISGAVSDDCGRSVLPSV